MNTNKLVILAFMFAFIFIGVSFAGNTYGMMSSGSNVKMLVTTDYTDSFDIYACPNEWSSYIMELYSGATKICDGQISFAGESCVKLNTKNGMQDVTTKGICTLTPGTTYGVKATPYDYSTKSYGNYIWAFPRTAETGYECNKNTLNCVSSVCQVTRGTCDAGLYDVQLYLFDTKANLLWHSEKSIWLKPITFAVPAAYSNFVLVVESTDVTAAHVDTQIIPFNTGTCTNPAFSTAISSHITDAQIQIMGDSLGEYTSFGWSLSKKVGTSLQYIDSGTITSKSLTLSGLYASTEYLVTFEGINRCGSGYFTSRTFTTGTSPVTIANFSLVTTYGTGWVNITITPNVSAYYEARLYNNVLGEYLTTYNSTTNHFVFNTTHLVYGTPYLVVIKSLQSGGAVYNQTVIELNSTNIFYLGLIQAVDTAFSASFELSYYNSTGQITFPPQRYLINNTWNSSTSTARSWGWVDGGADYYSYTANNLTNNTAYTFTSIVTSENDFSWTNSTTWTTPSINISDWYPYCVLEPESVSLFNAGLIDDVNYWCYAKVGDEDADSWAYRLWDNESGSPFLIYDSVNSSADYLIISQLIPDRRYTMEFYNVTFHGILFDSQNLTLIPSRQQLFNCNGIEYHSSFDAEFQYSNDNLYFKTTIYDTDTSQISTSWAAYVLYYNSTATWNGVIPAGYSEVSHNSVLNNNVDSFALIGPYKTDVDSNYVFIKRQVNCKGSTDIAATFTQFYTVPTSSVITAKYGLFQGLYDFFDDLFPGPTAKFFAIMFVSLLLGLAGWTISLLNSIPLSWAIGLLPVIIGAIICWLLGVVPGAVIAGLGLIIIALVLYKLYQGWQG
jgi:hypothetical protein